MFNALLIAIDGSKFTRHLLESAKSFCALYAETHLIYVGDIAFTIDPVSNEEDNTITAASDEQRPTNQLIQDSLDFLRQANIKVKAHIITGDTAEQIIKYAEEINAGLIIMGHRQMSKISRLLDPSTCMKVIENAPCPVLIENLKKD